MPSEKQEKWITTTVALELGRCTELHVDEPGRPNEAGERAPIEPKVMDALSVRVVEGAVLGVEVGEGELAAGSKQAEDRGEGGAGVEYVMEDEQGDGEVEWVVERRIGKQVEPARGHVRRAIRGQLLVDDLEHARRRIREHEFAQVTGQGEPEQPGPRADLDRTGIGRDRDGRPDRHGDGFGALAPLRRVPGPGPFVRVAARSSRTNAARATTSRPSGPNASTSAEATMTPSAPAFAIARTWAGRLTPNPTATGTGEMARTSRTSLPTLAGSDVRAPVTPTSETQ
jgi:hypothetical protein